MAGDFRYQYGDQTLLNGALRMRKAGLERFLSQRERNLLAKHDARKAANDNRPTLGRKPFSLP